MGYRSQVVLAVGKELMPHFLGIFAALPAARPLVFKHHDYMNENYDGKETFIVSWDDIKWYESYPDVDAINTFIDKCDGDEIEGLSEPWEHFRFLRLGEDSDDNIEKGYLHSCDICFHRSISY
jgi:hypothetical protein